MKKIIFYLFIIINPILYSQEEIEYQKPSKEILELADYERAPSIMMDTKKEYMLFLYRNTYKTLDELNKDEVRLAGLRINPNTNISSTINYINNIKIRKVNDAKSQPIAIKDLPKNVKITNIQWSNDDSKIAFTNTTNNGVELWVVDIKTAQAKKLTEDKLNASIGSPYAWYKDNNNLLVKFIPNDRLPLIDSKKDIPKGPIVQKSDGKTSQNRTLQDLLKNKTDAINFENIINSELYKVNINGTKTKIFDKDLYSGFAFSPDGNYILINKIKKPFSYIVNVDRFPNVSIVYNQNGKEIKIVNEVPLIENMPKGFSAVRKGKRGMTWRNDKPSSLYFIQALDDGDPANKVEFRDELFVWDAPFDKEPKSIAKTIHRFSNIIWGNDNIAIMEDSWYDTRNQKTYLINPENPTANKIIFDRNYQDIYSDPGNFSTKENEFGKSVLAIENNNLFLIGSGFTKEGQFPFIDEFNISTLKTNRIYKSKLTQQKEEILSIEDYKKGIAIILLQSKTDYPNYFFRFFKEKEKIEQLTFNNNPFEGIKNVHKEVIKYKRDDGVELSGTLYLPVNYDKINKPKLPLLIWAYPEEFKDKNSAGQSSKNPNEFTFPHYGSFIYWVTKGYVVLDNASFPIVGEGNAEPNDTFIKQLIANAKAAIDAVDSLGYIDRKKVAVGGHSYGAFMTANLLTHSDLFACGIARSGAYNRTLTPFGFQNEQRNFWDAPEVYNNMSPFYTANKMKKPILLVHGEADNNPGTFTLQTERYYQALKGLGANARMVILPKESHGYQAKENILHLLWEQEQFLDKYLK